MKVTTYTSIKTDKNDPEIGKVVDLYKVLQSIKKGGRHKELIEEIIKTEDKKERNRLKKQLPVICFNGEFKHRAIDGLVRSNGLIVLDIDGLSGKEESEAKRNEISKYPFVVSAFISPSYKGIKFIVRIPDIEGSTPEEVDHTFKGYFKTLLEKFPNLDISGKDISRACFFTYDPNIYINENHTMWTEWKEYKRQGKKVDDLEIPNIDFSNHKDLAFLERIVKADDGERHDRLLKVSRTAGGFIAAGRVKEDDAKLALEKGFKHIPWDEDYNYMKQINDGIELGLAYPIYDEETKNKKEVKEQLSTENGSNKYIYSWDRIDKELDDWFEGRVQLGETTGVQEFDYWFKFKKNSLYLCTGKLGRGKTTVQQFLFVMASLVNDWKWLIVAMENSKMDFAENLISFVLRMNAKEVKVSNPTLYNLAHEFVRNHFRFVTSEVNNIDMLLEVATEYHKSFPFDAMFIDPVNSIQPKAGHDWDFNTGVGAASKVLRFREEVASVFISQHPIMSKQRDSSSPSSADGEGGYFANKADFAFVLDRASGSNQTFMKIDKVRNRKTGGNETDPENPIELIYDYSNFEMRVPFYNNGMLQYQFIKNPLPKFPLSENTQQEEINLQPTYPQPISKENFDFNFGGEDEVPF